METAFWLSCSELHLLKVYVYWKALSLFKRKLRKSFPALEPNIFKKLRAKAFCYTNLIVNFRLFYNNSCHKLPIGFLEAICKLLIGLKNARYISIYRCQQAYL